MITIEEALRARIKAAENGSIESRMKLEGKEYQKAWSDAVQHFQKRINEDRRRDKNSSYPPMSFISVRQKLVALRDIDDLKWLYRVCQKYARTKDEYGNQNTFQKCFFGALKIRE